jgi:tRNA/tmRNA/rRNA uracil-C5-methylase (TrmA/RlmC/RlmD family)
LLVALDISLNVLQVNTLAAEKLYSLAGDWAGLGPDTLLFDVCCGTGTIGLTLAHRVGMVIVINPVPAFFLVFRHVIGILIVQCPK